MPEPGKPPAVKWDPFATFDATAQEIEVARKRQAIIARNKAEFRRLTIDPKNMLASGHGGTYVDNGLQRWYSGRTKFASFFTINGKSLAYFLGGYILPIAACYYFASKSFRERNQRALDGTMSKDERRQRAYLFC